MTQIEQKIEKYLDKALTEDTPTFPDRESAFAYVALGVAKLEHGDFISALQIGMEASQPDYLSIVETVFMNLEFNSSKDIVSYDPD